MLRHWGLTDVTGIITGNLVGWTRAGDGEHPRALAVVMSDASGGAKRMNAGRSRSASGFKRAATALARKLAVVLYAMRKSGKAFDTRPGAGAA